VHCIKKLLIPTRNLQWSYIYDKHSFNNVSSFFVSYVRNYLKCRNFSSKYIVFPSHIKKLKIKIYKTVILRVVLCGCETWSLALSEEHSLKVFENRD